MKATSPLTLPSLAIAAGAATPVPDGGAGSLAWSSSLGATVEWNGANWNKVDSAGGGGAAGVHFPLPFASGTYVLPMVVSDSTITVVPAATLGYAIPIVPARGITINELAVEVSTSLAGTAHAAIYADNGAGYPGAKIIGTAAGFNTGTTGVKTEAITPTTLFAGTVYWVVVYSSAAATFRAISNTSCLPIGFAATGGATVFNTLRSAAISGAPPANFPAGATAIGQSVPLVRFKVA